MRALFSINLAHARGGSCCSSERLVPTMERGTLPRSRVLKTRQVVFNRGHSVVDCRIRNVSAQAHCWKSLALCLFRCTSICSSQVTRLALARLSGVTNIA